jgi:hypothetical protein
MKYHFIRELFLVLIKGPSIMIEARDLVVFLSF